ncbi:DUF4252 domain-containing protein [Nonlabens marinus]|uniref:DUF4252 domain-containing protein n=1 Tax=Nonlabens marinus S1-08 TaxID=1454201 RepID=W8VS89_9FLAO|nr:DUF4252 domain-containing protein [Nonlabens marinus]BAO56085.1 hypothetical protein NMS_2076 [Nonlabens marinus S1-08]
MKKVIYIVLFLATAMTATAQNFDEVGNLSHVSETRVTGAMFKMISGIDIDDPEFAELMKTVNNLKDLRVYATDDKGSAAKMKSFADNFISKNNMDLLMSVKEDGQKFSFHVRKGNTETKIKELVMFIDGADSKESSAVFLVITGDLDLNQIAKITQQMNVPGQKQIKEATQKK